MQEDKICPYPGLRPFNEEESIFFRGREEHIERIIRRLSIKKFLMLTGASGDGKSSLVYAGVIPNARAGFFKAKFNNWIVADFRPERSPLHNLALALSDKLGYSDIPLLEKELSYGFSSLVNLYKNSPYHLDYESEKWKNAEEQERKILKRKAGNLFILVDQFEEFFTNSENYHNGKTSITSQLVVNLLLETARIALEQDLPIYIICTMRSDYIGQCAAFRGLPEYIGFSQFFVPRLKRKEVHQVIEEPATLSGNTISNRLTEILINELGEGFDQLPVLQHALNQVWKQADKGQQEMDLIHLAKLSGLPNSYLPAEDKNIFDTWFGGIPEFKKEFFTNPSLENVLNAHANELYETAFEFYNQKHSQHITKETACLIIRAVFQCLTKIDDARAVRNRMTLEEITNIINIPEIDSEMVAGVLELFRHQGNTFLKPFITYEEYSLKLKKDDILDITHESLIRNWSLLDNWAKEEYDNYLNFQDFNKQLQRWVTNNKTKGYLLPIGPLTFFEGWYNACKPNKYWLARYDESEDSFEKKLSKAEETLSLAQEFLKRSARKLFFTRTVMKYGANKLLTYLGIIVLVFSCTFFYFDYRKKQNNSVLNDIEHRGLAMLKSNKISSKVKAEFLISYERLHPGNFVGTLNSLNCDTLAYDIANKMFLSSQNIDDFDKVKVNPIVYILMDYMNNTLENIYNDKKLIRNDPFYRRFVDFVRLCAFIKSHEKDHSSIDNLMKQNVNRIYNDYLLGKLNQPNDKLTFDPIVFNGAIESVINYSTDKKDKAKIILSKISPFENKESEKIFDKLYSKDRLLKINWNFSFTHNGGYQELAILYAVSGDAGKVISCYDSIVKYNPNYKTTWRMSFKALALYIISSNSLSSKDINSICNKYEKYAGITHLKFVESVINSLDSYISSWELKNNSNSEPYSNFITSVVYKESYDKIFDYYINEVKTEVKDKNELSFNMAIINKKRGMNSNLNKEQREYYFEKALLNYNSLPKAFLETDAVLGTAGSANSKNIKKSVLFLYPNAINEDQFWQSFWLDESPDKLKFVNYLNNKHLLTQLYFSKDEWKMYDNFLNHLFIPEMEKWNKKDSISYSYFDLAEKFLHTYPLASATIDSNYVYLKQSVRYFELGDTSKAFKYYRMANSKVVLSEEFQKGDDQRGDNHKEIIKLLARYFAVNSSNIMDALKLSSCFYEPYFRRNTLINIVLKLQEKGPIENSCVYLDSIYKYVDKEPKYGLKLLQANAMVGSQALYNLTMKMIKDVNDKQKPRALILFVKGVAFNGYYYKALGYIPDYVSSSNELELYTEIMKAEVKKRLKVKQKLEPKYIDPFKYYDDNNDNSYWGGDYENGQEGTILVYGDE